MAQTPPTDLALFVHREQLPERHSARLPAPVADPRLDIHVDRCTAQAGKVGKLDGHQKRIGATVVGFPFYDPDKTRVRDVAEK